VGASSKRSNELRDRLEQRAPNHAWVAPLARFAGVARGTGVAGANTVLLVAIGALLALVAVVVLAWQNLPGTATTAQRAHRAEPIAATVARVVHASPGADAMAPSLGSVPVDPTSTGSPAWWSTMQGGRSRAPWSASTVGTRTGSRPGR
jgi:hypothetical protein